MNRVSVISFLLMLVFVFFSFFFTNKSFVPVIFILAILFLLISVFNVLGFLRFARFFASVIPLFAVGVVTLASVKAGGDKYFLIPASLIPMVLYKERWKYILLFDIYVLAFILATYYQNNYPPLWNLGIVDIESYYHVNMISLFFTTFIIMHYFIGTNNEYENEILQKNELLNERNKEITDSIRYARRLQQAILVRPQEIKKELPDSCLLYQPKDIVAGDFYFFEQNQNSIYLAAADCTGHGVPGALVSVVCSNALTRSVKEFNFSEPGAILTKTRELVLDTFQKSAEEIKDGMDISLMVFNKETKTMKWSGANNPLWIYRADKQTIEVINADKQAIGYTEQAKDFTTHQINYNCGDIFYLFTDGYADQFGGSNFSEGKLGGKKFKYARLKDLLLQNSQLPLEELKQLLLHTFENWKGDLEQVDDVCIIAVRV